jgi:glycosyltransferase involved in cell wall biosynthesis
MVARIGGIAGPAGFQQRLAAGLSSRGIEVSYDLDDRPYEAALVIGGTRALPGLSRAKRLGVPIAQRLDGINWIHRRRRTGVRHFLRAEANNLLLRWIRDRLADVVIYQSHFARSWWDRKYGPAPGAASVVWNGVPLDVYKPAGIGTRPEDRLRLLLVEANLAGGYEVGLEAAVELARRLQSASGRRVELAVAGRVPRTLQQAWEGRAADIICWLGVVPPEDIPALDRSAHLLYAADLLPACPNAVIEALACGLPVVAFSTGALAELVTENAGGLAPYGGDPWRLDPPDTGGLARAAERVLADLPRFRAGARARAVEALGLDAMVDGYLEALGWSRR